MRRFLLAIFALAISVPAQAQDKLVISIWGGSWRDLIAETVAKKFTADTGVPVEFITGGTIDRLNKEKLAKGNPESDITFTTSHVGWLYANDGLFEQLDLSKIPNAANLADEARISPFHLGAWAYVYTIGYRADLLGEFKFESWNDLWKPEMKGKIAGPDFDPSHIIAVAAMLSGGGRRALGKRAGQAQGAEAQLQGVLHQRCQQPAICSPVAKRRYRSCCR